MREVVDFRIPEEKAAEYLSPADGVFLGLGVRKVELPLEHPLVKKICSIHDRLEKKGDYLYLMSYLTRQYSQNELLEAEVLSVQIQHVVESAGEECGSVYDDSVSCDLCGAGGRLLSGLKLDSKRLPRRGKLCIAKSIAGEVVVTDEFRRMWEEHRLTGASFHPVKCGDQTVPRWQHLVVDSPTIDVVEPTKTEDPFHKRSKTVDVPCETIGRRDFTYGSWCDVVGQYRCPRKDTIGIGVFSELWIEAPLPLMPDLAATRQFVGVRRGLCRPERLLVCSQRFHQLFSASNFKGLKVEVAHLRNRREC
jgi:hypothetical protein